MFSLSRVGRPIVRFVLYYTIADIMNSRITDRLILKTDHYLFCINLPTILTKTGGCHTPNTPCLGTPLRVLYVKRASCYLQTSQTRILSTVKPISGCVRTAYSQLLRQLVTRLPDDGNSLTDLLQLFQQG